MARRKIEEEKKSREKGRVSRRDVSCVGQSAEKYKEKF